MVRPSSVFSIGGIHPWGSFGNILIHGFLWDEHTPEHYELVRAGPVVPPISFPSGYFVVTDPVKVELEKAGFLGIGFNELPLGKVVESDWHNWDRSEPEDYTKMPDDDSMSAPEDLIFVPKHRPDLAHVMPRFWLTRGTSVSLDWESAPDGLQVLSWSKSGFNDWDFFMPGECVVFLSMRAKNWFADRYAEWLVFEEIQVGD